MVFNKDFLWGGAVATHQLEGGWNEGLQFYDYMFDEMLKLEAAGIRLYKKMRVHGILI